MGDIPGCHLTHPPPLCRTHASVNWVSISSGNGLSPVWCQSITWTNAGSLSIRLLGTNFNEIRIGILSFSFKKIHPKLSSAKMASFCPGGDELISIPSHSVWLMRSCRLLHSISDAWVSKLHYFILPSEKYFTRDIDLLDIDEWQFNDKDKPVKCPCTLTWKMTWAEICPAEMYFNIMYLDTQAWKELQHLLLVFGIRIQPPNNMHPCPGWVRCSRQWSDPILT